MAGENNDRLPVRRQFLTRIAAGAAGSRLVLGNKARADNAITEPASPLPTIRIGDHRITRLVAGWNPIGGYSYLGPNLDRYMAEYFTPEHILGWTSAWICTRSRICGSERKR
jgi:hypothetical protein